VPPAKRQGTHEQELRTGIVAASGLTIADRWIFTVLTTMADWGTAKLPDRFAPRSLAELAAKCNVSERQVKYSLGHLQRHGWVERYRNITEKGIGGRGHPTRYVLLMGRDCDCKTGQSVHSSGEIAGTECPGKGAEAVAVDAGQPGESAGVAVMGEEGWAAFARRPSSWD
jgi:hypothetical protein